MIAGVVASSLEPILSLTVRGPTGRECLVPFVVDTGYSGEILMPPHLIEALDLKWVRADFAELADGSEIEHRVFAAEVDWDGIIIQVAVDEADTVPLLGTKRIRGYELTAQMRPHGKLTLKKLPPKRTSKKRKP